MITSDHGHLSAGGSGGIANVLKSVPLILYKRNSNLNTLESSLPRFRTSIKNTDIAPTISGILGIPVPRQSQGVFIPEAIPLFDQTSLLKHFQVNIS